MNLARLVHPGFWFGKTSLSEAVALAKRGVGGFCLYGGTRAEVASFTAAVRKASPCKRLLISADYEDGLGRWLPDAPLLPSNMALGAAQNETLAFEKGLLTAQQARSLGVDWIFAPVVDLADNPLNPIVNTRSFGEDPSLVIRLASAFLNGIHQGGALSSLKHFPGHGDTTTDSHLALPVLTKSSAQLHARELAPFQALLSQTDSVMLGHLLIPQLDEKNPASLSPTIAHTLLRQQLQYDGCVLTDALLMKAIGDEKQAALHALHAGVDILLVPQHPNELIDFLTQQNLPHALVHQALAHQDHLCQKVLSAAAAPSPQEAFAPNNLGLHTAQQAIVQQGTSIKMKPGQTWHYIEVGADHTASAQVLKETLRQHGVLLKPFEENAQNVLVISLRRYQAFQGKIALEAPDVARLKHALAHATHSVGVVLASPWALPIYPTSTLFTFSPAPEFQQTAAEILLGQRTAQGKMPILPPNANRAV